MGSVGQDHCKPAILVPQEGAMPLAVDGGFDCAEATTDRFRGNGYGLIPVDKDGNPSKTEAH